MLMVMRCPTCNAELKVDDGRDFYFCSYCGTKIMNVAQKVEVSGNVSIDNSATISNLLIRANRSSEDRLYSEALECYSKILDMDANNAAANSGYYYCKAILTDNPRDKVYLLKKSLEFNYYEPAKREYDKVAKLLVIKIDHFPGKAAVKFSIDGSRQYTDIRSNYYVYDGVLSAGTHRVDFAGYTTAHTKISFSENHACQCTIYINIKENFAGFRYELITQYEDI